MKKNILALFVLSVSLILTTTAQSSSEFNPFRAHIISRETENINGSLLIKAEIVFNDTVLWNFSQEYEFSDSTWTLNQITSLNGQTFYPNDTVIVFYNLNYNVANLPFYPETFKIEYHISPKKH
jgi:hypothetical protein